jgi:hypothetical protein
MIWPLIATALAVIVAVAFILAWPAISMRSVIRKQEALAAADAGPVNLDGYTFRSKRDTDAYAVTKDFGETVKRAPESEQREHMLRDTERAMAIATERPIQAA